MSNDLSNVKVGDTLAVPNRTSPGIQRASHSLIRVERLTNTQLVCSSGKLEWRVRKSDGKVFDRDYIYAQVATPELIASVNEQKARIDREFKVRTRLNDLIGVPLHRLNLDPAQLEVLAEAWDEVKAMGETS